MHLIDQIYHGLVDLIWLSEHHVINGNGKADESAIDGSSLEEI